MFCELYKIVLIKERATNLLKVLFKKLNLSEMYSNVKCWKLHWELKIKPLEAWEIKVSKRTCRANNKRNANTQNISSKVTEDLSQDEGTVNQ